LGLLENTNASERRYLGLVTQASYTFGDATSVGGNYTLSHSSGNLEGETVNGGPSGADVNSYPEYKRASWNSPEGSLLIDQKHRVRIWGTYVVHVPGSTHGVTLGLVQQIASGVPYAAVTAINPTPYVQNPGYLTPPVGVNYYFSSRDAYHLDTTYRTDISVNYSFRFAHGGGSQPEMFFHGEVLNVLNQFQLCGCGDTVFSNGGVSNLTTIGQAVRLIAPFNPFTDTPVKGVNWDLNPNFGTPLNAFAYTSPRIVRFSVGLRF
jgi:hypothetical protein